MLGAMKDDSLSITQGKPKCSRCRTDAVCDDANPLCRYCSDMDKIMNSLKQLERSQEIGFTKNQSLLKGLHSKMPGAMEVVSKLDMKWSNAIPRLFVILRAERKKGFNARSHLRSLVQTKYHLYFVCADSLQAVSPPLKLLVGQQWLRKIAPLLSVSLKVLTMASKAVTGIPIDLDTLLGEMDLDCEKLKELLEDILYRRGDKWRRC